MQKMELQTNHNLTAWTSKTLPSSISETINLTSPSLAKVRKQNKQIATVAIMKCLTDFRNLLSIDHYMTADQISYCAESIVASNEFYMLRLEDFDLCFRMALNGELGQIYNRMDQPCVFKFLCVVFEYPIV